MAEALKITLPSALDTNVNYPKLEELRIRIETIVEGAFVQMNIMTNAVTNAHIIGSTTTQFTNSDGTANLGKSVTLTVGANTLRFKANSTFFIAIENKFAVTRFGDSMSLFTMVSGGGNVANNIRCYLNLKDIKYVNYARLRGDSVFSGDLADINKTALTYLYADKPLTPSDEGTITGAISSSTLNFPSLSYLSLANQDKITGSISGANLANIASFIFLGGTNIGGTITALNNSIQGFTLNNTDIAINLSAFAGKTALYILTLSGSLAFGNIAGLSSVGMERLSELKGLNLSGDVAQLHNNTVFVSNVNPTSGIKNANAHLSTTYWTNKKAGRQYILAAEMTLTSGVDQYLIDMAELDLHPNSTSISWLKTLTIRGARTAASNAAVATLTGKGVTVVMINP